MAPTITDTTPQQAHDVRLLELLREHATAEHRLMGHRETLRAMTDMRSHAEKYRHGYRKVTDPRTFEQVLADFEAIAAQGREGRFASGYTAYSGPQSYLDKHDALVEALRLAAAAVREHEAAYTGWSRFWLVTSSPGHIHSSMGCSTCRASTTFALVPSLSASTADAAIEMFGPAMCSVCFPDAPTGLKVSKALAESVGTDRFETLLAKHRAKAGL